MPCISEFYGILIYMYWREHEPPHFHAVYAEYEAEIEIRTGRVIDGDLPRRALRLVREWARAHVGELDENWDRARRHEDMKKIEGLL